ncbi:hypothetical protein VTI74DRAFT_11098 [Chaetomium olivicolor]
MLDRVFTTRAQRDLCILPTEQRRAPPPVLRTLPTRDRTDNIMPSSQPLATGPQGSHLLGRWQEGDVCFLKPYEGYSPNRCSPDQKETKYPFIVLRWLSSQSDHVLITPVSAFNYTQTGLAPREQVCHKAKDFWHFWTFEGTRRYRKTQAPLRLIS